MEKIGSPVLESEIVCDACGGTGLDTGGRKWNRKACSKCFGIGKVDWIENITGKKREEPGIIIKHDVRNISGWKIMFDWIFCPGCNFKSKMRRIDWPYQIGWKCDLCGWVTWLR